VEEKAEHRCQHSTTESQNSPQGRTETLTSCAKSRTEKLNKMNTDDREETALQYLKGVNKIRSLEEGSDLQFLKVFFHTRRN
jgi:hypothetical protein